nr:ATP-binding protein [uncultured Sellimonas sp.]
MRKRIQRSMMLILAVTLLLFYAIMSVILYNRNLELLKREVKQEAEYICTAVNISGSGYLEKLSQVDEGTRVTQIDDSGNVLYDSSSEEEDMENHGARQEVKEALASGTGESVRMSNTLGRELYYYAVLLDNGTVLRVAKSMDNLAMTALNVFPVIGGLAVLMIAFALFLAKWQTKKLIRPINELDLEHPLENTLYEELTPLLVAMDKQNKEKEAVSNMRKEFSANVSHELKTPLTSISGYAEIMKNGMVRPADIPVFSERIYKEARRLITLVEDIIKLSKLDEESVELEKEEVDLYELTREIVSRLSPQVSQKHIRMEVTGEPVECYGIRQILDEMVYNVCENAIKYNNEGGRVSVWVGNTLEGPKVSVSDTGIGIPKEHQERIFERFYRVDKSHSKERGGTGLGLSIVKHGALLHGAKVSVDSVPGKGTRIEMLFPKGKK